MNTTAPWSIKGIGFETREAAKDAARRSGLSLGDWLDGIISERASELGVAKADVGADERLEAVAAKLSRFVNRAAAEEDEAGMARKIFGTLPQQEEAKAHAAATGTYARRGRGASPLGQRPWPDDEEAMPGPRARTEESTESRNVLFDPLERDFRATQTAIADFRERAAQFASPGIPSENPPETGAQPRRPQQVRRFDERTVRDAVAEIARRQADLDAAAHPNREGPTDVTSIDVAPPGQPKGSGPKEAEAPAAAAPGRGYSLSDMNEAVTALAARMEQGSGVSKPESEPGIRAEAQPESRSEIGAVRAPWNEDFGAMSRSFDTLARELRQAIKDIDPRSSVENLDREVRAIGRKVETMSVGTPDDRAIHRIGEQTQEMRDLLTAAASRPPMIGNVERQMAKLETRMAQLADVPRDMGLGSEQVLSEVRAMLDRFRPGAAVETLERRIEELSNKIDHELGLDSSSSMISKLAHRIEEIHGSLRAEIAAPSVDTKSLEALVRGIADRIEDARAASADFHNLEVTMRDLATKFEAGKAQPDVKAVHALESQIARLGDRLERSEASLKTLDSVEHALGELFNQLEETRHAAIDAAENAARVAARDTLRAAMHNQAATPRPPEASSGMVEQVSQGIADLRSMQDASERRTQATLSGLSQMIEQLIEHLAQQANQENRTTGMPHSAAVAEPIGMRESDPVERVREAESARTAIRAEPAGQDRPRRRNEPPAAGSIDPSEMLIEPGSGRAPKRLSVRDEGAIPAAPAPIPGVVPGVEPPNPAEAEGPAAFIAAARRAAQAAQASAAAASHKPAVKQRPAAIQSPQTALSTIERARSFLAHRRRPILLSLAGLVLLLGALEVFKISIQRAPAEATVGRAEITAPQGADAARGDEAIADQMSGNRQASGVLLPGGNAPANIPTIAAPAVPNAMALSPAAKPRSAPVLDANNQAGSAKPESVARPPVVSGLPGVPAQGGDPAMAGIGEGLRSLAAGGDRAAQFEVALRFSEGRGVTRDPKLAASWFQKAAGQGLVPAEYRLGSAYEKGVGVARDPALAMAWYGRAAEAGNIRAMHNLAVMAAEGAAGKPDYARAAGWFQRAAALGVRDSQFNLAILYARGLGIEQSLAQSYTWFSVAAGQGDDDAAKKRDEVAARLDAKTLATAKAAADNFHADVGDSAANDVPAPPGGWDAVAPMRQPPAGAKPAAPRVSSM